MPSTPNASRTPAQVRLNPALIGAVRASGCSVRRLAAFSGFTRPNESSDFLCRDADAIPLTALNVRRLHTFAALVGFARDQIFIPDAIDSEATP